jgi:23S rRNA (adenine2503-C2)-methyltransferase
LIKRANVEKFMDKKPVKSPEVSKRSKSGAAAKPIDALMPSESVGASAGNSLPKSVSASAGTAFLETNALPESLGIKRYGESELAALMAGLGQPHFRTRQLIEWLYARSATEEIDSYDKMSNLPASLRTTLAEREAIAAPKLVTCQCSTDGTRKYLLELADGARVECVGIPEPGRLTVCFSTQVGCGMGCVFCATGQLGFTRQLAPGEMVDQLLVVSRDFGQRVSGAVAMGEGEPLANYANTLAALRLMNAPYGLGIGARHLTLSTSGLLTGVQRLGREPEQFTLAISLHSAVQRTRNKLLPGLRNQPLTDLHDTLEEYIEQSGRRVSLEYALIDGINDTDNEIEALIAFCRGLRVYVNLILLNPLGAASGGGAGASNGANASAGAKGKPSSGDASVNANGNATAKDRVAGKSAGIAGLSELAPSSPARVAIVERLLTRAGIENARRRSRGADISGACGQLAAGK